MSTPSEDLGSGSITITLDEAGVENDARTLGRKIERILETSALHAGRAMTRNIRRAFRELGPMSVVIEADTRKFYRELRRIYTIDDIDVSVRPDSRGFIAALQRQLRGQTVEVRVVPDFTGFDTAIRNHPTPTVNVRTDVDSGALSKLTKALGALGSAAGTAGKLIGMAAALTTVAAAAVQASAAIVGLVAALAPMGGIIAAFPALALGAAASFGVLKLATAGVGDAMKAAASGDAKKLAEALKGLAPAAKTAVLAVRDLAPSFRTLRKSVQQNFFKRFQDEVKTAGTALLGLGPALDDVGRQFGDTVGQALKFVGTADAINPMKQILNGVGRAAAGLEKSIAPVIKGFLDVGAAVATAFGAKTGQAIENVGLKFGTYLSVLAASGGAVEKVSAAVAVFKQLGTVLGNVGSIFGSFTKAAQAESGGLLGNLVELTTQAKEFFASASGQEALQNVFSTINELARQLGPILTTLATQIGQIAPAIGPILETLGPVITRLLEALGSGIQNVLPGIQTVVEKLGAALTNLASSGAIEQIGTALSVGLEALAPLLPVIGQLATTVLPILATAFTAVANALSPVITELSAALLPVLPILGGAFTKLITAASPLFTLLGGVLGQVIAAAAPLLTTLATAFDEIVTAIAPLISEMLPVLEPLLLKAVEIFKQLVAAILPMVPATVSVLVALVPLGAKIFELIGPVLELATQITGWVALDVVIPVIEGIVLALTTFAGWVTTVITYVSDFKANVTRDFNELKAGVVLAIETMKALALAKFNELKDRAILGFETMKQAVVNKFNELKQAAISRTTELVSSVTGYFRELPGRIGAAMAGAVSILYAAGGQMIQGMINGVRAKAGELIAAARNVVGSAVSAAKSALGISSPSKVFAEIGRFTAQGLINGLTGSISQVEQTADRLAEAITKAFKGKNTRVRDALIAQLRVNEKELLKLVNRREALAKKIKEANDFAASVTSRTQQAFGLQEAAAAASKAVGGLTIGNITESLDVAIAKIRNFNKQINSLAKKGLNKNLLEELIGLGPEAGADLANVLDQASRADLKELSRVQAELDKSAKKLGKDSADHLFDAGKEASKGFLAGLEAQQDDIEKLMLSIAKSIQKSIKQALGIKSPSKVMARLGKFAGEGLSLGLDGEARNIRRASIGAVRAITDPFSGGQGVSANSVRQGLSGAATGTTNNRTLAPVINITEVGDARATAQRVVNRLAAAALV